METAVPETTPTICQNDPYVVPCSPREPSRTCLAVFDGTLSWEENVQQDPAFAWKAKATWWLFEVPRSGDSAVLLGRPTHGF